MLAIHEIKAGFLFKEDNRLAVWGYARVSTVQQNEDRQIVEI